MIFFITDICMYLIVMLIFVSLYLFKNDPLLEQTWGRLKKDKKGLISGYVVGFFFTICLLDSIHFTSNNSSIGKIYSALDYIIKPIIEKTEKTYSEPFSSTSYVIETEKDINNNIIREYPKLKHVKYDSLKKFIFNNYLIIFYYLLISFGINLLFRIIIKKYKRKKIIVFIKLLTNIILIYIGIIYISSNYYVFGTDKIGIDIFYQILKSIRTAFCIGCITTLLILPIAIIMGTIAGYYSGWIDDAIQYIYTVISSVPSVLLIISMILVSQVYIDNNISSFTSIHERADIRLFVVCLALGLTSWTSLCRVIRAETLKIKSMEFVLAAKIMGRKNLFIIFKHIIPNLYHIIIISIILDFSALVMAEVVLTYVGVGVSPVTYSWGNIINASRLELSRAPIVWWPILFSFITMVTLILCANIFSDSLRRAMNPKNI